MKKYIIIFAFFSLYCSSPKDFQYDVFYPKSNSGILSYYIDGIPFGAFFSDSLGYIISLEKVNMIGNYYLRLWLLCQNNYQESYLLDPINIAKIKINYKNKTYDLLPETPSKLLSDVENDKQVNLITQTIGSTLKAINTHFKTKNTKITDGHGNEITVHDREEKVETKVDQIGNKFENKLNNIENWYDIYSSSINNGILRKNTMFNNLSVNGYIYFNLENFSGGKEFDRFDVSTYEGNNKANFEESKVSLLIETKSGYKEIEFVRSKSN